MKKLLVVLMFFFMIFSFNFLLGSLALRTSIVGPGGEMVETFSLNRGDFVTGNLTFHSTGYMMSFGGFTITGPGNYIVLVEGISDNKVHTFSFTAEKSGEYKISIQNYNILQSTQVTLDYTLPPTIALFANLNLLPFLPFLIFLIILAVGGSLIIYRYKQNQPKKIIEPPVIQQQETKQVEPIQIPKSEIICGSCNTRNDLDAIFCKKCGARFK